MRRRACPGCDRKQHPRANPRLLPGAWLSCQFCPWTGDEFDWWPDE